VTARRSRGFTLLEVLIGAAVALVVIGIVLGTFLSSSARCRPWTSRGRRATRRGRDALDASEHRTRRLRIDPKFAFDFRNYSCPNWTAATPCRDKIDGPDEIVFVFRDANYYWRTTRRHHPGLHQRDVLGPRLAGPGLRQHPRHPERECRRQVPQGAGPRARLPQRAQSHHGPGDHHRNGERRWSLQLTLDASLGTLLGDRWMPTATTSRRAQRLFRRGGAAPSSNARLE